MKETPPIFKFPENVAYAHFNNTGGEVGQTRIRDFTVAYFIDHQSQQVYAARSIFNPHDRWHRGKGDINAFVPAKQVERLPGEKNLQQYVGRFGGTIEEAKVKMTSKRFLRDMNQAQFNRKDGRKYSLQALEKMMALQTHEERLALAMANPRIYCIIPKALFVEQMYLESVGILKDKAAFLRQEIGAVISKHLQLFDISVTALKQELYGFYMAQDTYILSHAAAAEELGRFKDTIVLSDVAKPAKVA